MPLFKSIYFSEQEALIQIKDLNNKSVRSILKKLGVPPASFTSQYTHIEKIVKHYKVDTSHWLGMAWNRGLTYEKKPISIYLSNQQSVSSYKLKLRLLKNQIKKHQCESCSLTKWKDQDIPLELHHVDGNKFNNALENLELLCPNCHAFTKNYRQQKNKKRQPELKEKDIIKALKSSHSRHQAMLKLGLSVGSGNYDKFDKVIKEQYIIFAPKIIQRDRSIPTNPNWRHEPKISQRKVKDRPTKEELEKMVWSKPTTQIAKQFGVSDNAIAKWCEIYSIKKPSRGYWAKQQALI